MSDTPRIVVIGAGFAALTAVRELRRRAPAARITVIAPKAEFVYLPSLIWIPTGLRKAGDLIFPLDRFFRNHNVEFIPARVTGLSDDSRTVITEQHGEIANDALLIASGGRFIKKLPGIEHALTLCEGVTAAEAIRKRLEEMDGGRIALGFGGNPNEPSAMRGGPMFELLFGIDTWLRKNGKRDKIGLTFFNAVATPGKRLGDKAVTNLLAEMSRRNIATHLGHKPTGFSERGVDTEGGHVAADLILFMPGLTGPVWLDNTTLPRSAGGFIQADEFCRVHGFEKTFVAGDAGSFPGPDWIPKQAHMADLQAKAACRNLLLELEGKAPLAQPKPELICIIDAMDTGTLVYRSPARSYVSSPSRLFHWAKSVFEKRYLRVYR